MQFHIKSHSHHLFHLILIACITSGILGYVPSIMPGDVALADPPPPPFEELEEEAAEDQATMNVQPSTPPQSLLPNSSPIAHTIYLKSRQFQPSAMDALDAQSLQQLARPDRDRVHILVQLDFIPRQTAKAALKAHGVHLLAYVPDYAWIASVPATNPAAMLESPGVTWAGELTVDDKLDPAIRADAWGSWNLAPDGTAAIYVAMHQDESLETGRQLAKAYGGKVTGEVYGINLLIVEIPRENIRALAAEEAVQWIEPAAPPLTETNDGIRAQIGVDALQDLPYDLDGTGINVLVYDSGQVGDHPDFGTPSRLTHGDADTISDHSTHVAGTVGGDGSQGGPGNQWRGMAPAVDIISYGTGYPGGTGVIFYERVPDIESDWAAAQNTHFADLGTASVGSNLSLNYPSQCDLMGNYGGSAVLIDQIVRGGNSQVDIGDKYIATWSAGNERGVAACGTTYSTIAPPSTAKNPIHIGASNTDNNSMTTFSSWGPTDDGRIKPTVVAGGDQVGGDGAIMSTVPDLFIDLYSSLNCDGFGDDFCYPYDTMQGTSMATPAVAGGIALMLQHYRDVYNTSGNFWPSTAKAILMQTAQDFGNPGPDYQWGYGQVDIHAAVDLISRQAFRQESITQGQVDVFYFIVPDDATPATVSLAWDDHEATFNANPTLINNLDLELVAPDGTLWRPWVLDPANPANNATRGLDNRNNQEQVQVFAADEDIIGTWLVRVKGTSVPQGPQDYSLVCEGCKPLNLGVCQDEVSGAAMAAASPPEVEGPMLDENGAGDGLISIPTLHDEPSAGELWQRSLEAQSAARTAVQTAEREAEIQTALAAVEAAREDGPEAVVALFDTLRGEALDLVMDEITEAQEQLAEMAPPRPATPPISLAEEQAMLQAQQAVEAANRARALAPRNDPFEGQTQISESANQQAYPARPTTDLTVGNGCAYATIASAIAAAIPGDRLLIEGGHTFTENLSIPISLTLQGGYDGCASGSTDRTTVDGNASGSVIQINGGLSVTLESLIVTNGSIFGGGGGIHFASGPGTLNLTYVDIYTNTALGGGGLGVGEDAEVVGTNVEIYDNWGAVGGGVYLYGGRATFSGNSTIHDNIAAAGGGVHGTLSGGFAPSLNLPSSTDVHDNRALIGDGFGGGVYMSEGAISLADCSDILSNDAIAGGGAYLVTSTLTINGSCSEIQDNTATGDGGGVYAQGSSVNLDDQAELYSNDAGTDGSGSGGGAYLDDSDLWSDRASIRYNTADDFGGGVYATNDSRVDMDIDDYACMGVRCSRLSNNTINDFGGGGVYANDSTVDLRNTFVEDNSANLGGGVYAQGSTVTVYNNLFAENDSTNVSPVGDAIRLYTGSSMNGSGNTLVHNDAGGASTGQAIGISGASLTLGCSIIWGHTSSIDLAGQNVTYSDIEGGYAGAGNLDVNPLFVNPAVDDYHLQSTSPVIDRCVSGLSPDFENDTRPIVRTTAASPYDMGADEVAGVDRIGVNGACAYGTIQQAVNAASDGDTIRVAGGVYFENVNIVNKSLTIQGGYDSTCTTPTASATRIEGSAGSGSTFDISNSAVTLRDLQVAWGNDTFGGGIDAVGGSQVTLDNTAVLNNHATYGGGFYISTDSVVTITNDSDVHDNTASDPGGGARVWGRFYGSDNASDIYENCAPDGGGFYVPGGSLYLNNADVYLNQAADVSGKGGGIYVDQGGVVTMTNSAYVYYLNEAYDGAGIYADAATVYMAGGTTTIRDNVAANNGGGVYLSNNSTLRSVGARIGQPGSTLANEAVRGAGMYVVASTVDFSGRIINNIATGQGAGIYADASTLNLTDAQVGGTGDYEANQLTGILAIGAGLCLINNTQATLNNTVVSSNTLPAGAWIAAAGGVYASDSTLTLVNSRVERHLAPASSGGTGAGIYAYNSTVMLDNSQVLSNTAGNQGGGLMMYNASTLNIANDSSIRNNQSLNSAGGGIAVDASSGVPDVNISDSTLRENTAGTDGGAIAIYTGTLDFSGWWDVQSNQAGGNGGGIAVLGTGDVDFLVTDSTNPSYLSNNTAYGDGGALYVGNNDHVPLYAYSNWLGFSGNYAAGNGGGAYADSGAYFDTYGQVLITANRAPSGNGGAFYLSGGSLLWLDDYYDSKPQLRVNWAENGGAVYASDSPSVQCDGAEFGWTTSNGNRADAGSGGAIYLSGSNFDAENCVFHDGQATDHGGAIAAFNNSTLTIDAYYLTPSAAATPEADHSSPSALLRTSLSAPQASTACDPLAGQCSSFYSNTADSDASNSGNGGAIYANNSTLQIDHTYLHRNSAYYGGAIFQDGASASAQVSNSLIYSNTTTYGIGAGIRASGGSFTMTHVTLANNMNGAAYSQPTSGVSSAAHNSIAWGNPIGFFRTFVTYTCNIDQESNVGIAVDPQFMAPGAGEDYHLRSSSPAIDACATGLPTDLDNVARPLDSGYDMGAYEGAGESVIYLPLVTRNY